MVTRRPGGEEAEEAEERRGGKGGGEEAGKVGKYGAREEKEKRYAIYIFTMRDEKRNKTINGRRTCQNKAKVQKKNDNKTGKPYPPPAPNHHIHAPNPFSKNSLTAPTRLARYVQRMELYPREPAILLQCLGFQELGVRFEGFDGFLAPLFVTGGEVDE